MQLILFQHFVNSLDNFKICLRKVTCLNDLVSPTSNLTYLQRSHDRPLSFPSDPSVPGENIK